MKNVLIVISLLIGNCSCFSQDYQWAKGIGSISGDFGNSIAVDSLGYIYIAGSFSDSVDFDPDTGTVYIAPVGSDDIFFAKYNANGNYLWAKCIGSTSSDYCQSIAVDGSGNVYITGDFRSTADFDPGIGTAYLITVGSNDIFFAKYDNSGNYLWSKNIGSTSSDYSQSIAIDGSGNVYITGVFQGIADFDPGIGTANLTAVGSNDIFFAKYDNSGNYLWAKNIGGTNNDYSFKIDVDISDNIYITGYFIGTSDFDPSTGTANLTAVGSTDIFFAKYDSNGNYLWAKSIGSGSSESCRSIAVDGSGNVYITGFFSGTADFDPGTGTANLTPVLVGYFDIFFAKYDNSGNYLWAKSIGSTFLDAGRSIAIDESGHIYITGGFQGTADFDPGPGTANLTAIYYDIFLAKYDNNGNYLWAKSIGNTSVSEAEGASITVDISEGVYITGYFQDTADFDPDTGTVNLTAVGSKDIFFAKFSQTPVGIKEQGARETDGFSIYPNPANDRINILTKEKATLEIINIQGQIVDSKSLTEKVNNIDISKLSSGVYTLRIKTDRGIAIRKLIKQ